MYSDKIILRRTEQVESATKVRLKRHAPSESQGRALEIHSLVTDKGLKRPLTREESLFCINEVLLSMCDFRYFAERYATIDIDPEMGGGVGPMTFWASQEIMLKLIGQAEESQWDSFDRAKIADGIRIACHKARQLGATMLARALMLHRVLFHKNTRSLAASVSEGKILELYRRDKLILDNLPWFLHPSIGFDVKSQHLHFDRLNSHILYQQGLQHTGIGQGSNFPTGHLTECASWEYPLTIENDFFPTLPRSIDTLAFLESAANGRGNWWHSFSEAVRAGRRVDWIYSFTPWYIEPKRYRRNPPVDWRPFETTVLAARKIEDTSPRLVGYRYSPSPEQMYWWETTRRAAQGDGDGHVGPSSSTLNIFLTNYCATPEESFQHSGQAAFDAELMERLDLRARAGVPYELIRRAS